MPKRKGRYRESQALEFLAAEARTWAALTLDAEGHVASWNAGAEHLLGYRSEEILGEDARVLFAAEGLEQHGCGEELRRAALKGRIEEEARARRKEGSVFWAEVITRALRDKAGALQGFALVLHDQTQRKGAEAGLQLYMELWENMPNGLLILHQEKEHGAQTLRILAANPAILPVIRRPELTVDDLIDKTPAEVLPGLFARDVTASASEVIGLGTAREGGEVHYRSAQGPEATFSIKAFPLPDQCVGLIFENITERKRAEEALRASEAEFRGLLDVAPNAMLITDQEGRIVLMNRAAEVLFGYLREELEEQPVDVLLFEGFRERRLTAGEAYLAEPRAWVPGVRFEARGRRKDGSEFPAEISLGFWKAPAGLRACSVIRDLTKTKPAGQS